LDCISSNKSIIMQIEVEVLQPITVGRQNVDDVVRFTYVDSILVCDDAEADVNCRIGNTSSVYQRMWSIWTSSAISTDTKVWLYKATVVSVGIYASETWKITTNIGLKLNDFQ